MIPKIKNVIPLEDYMLRVSFDDGKEVIYDVKEDIRNISDYSDLIAIRGLFQQVRLDQSRTCVFWNDKIDLSSDTIYEFGAEAGFERCESTADLAFMLKDLTSR